jgi:hypothetical protein
MTVVIIAADGGNMQETIVRVTLGLVLLGALVALSRKLCIGHPKVVKREKLDPPESTVI